MSEIADPFEGYIIEKKLVGTNGRFLNGNELLRLIREEKKLKSNEKGLGYDRIRAVINIITNKKNRDDSAVFHRDMLKQKITEVSCYDGLLEVQKNVLLKEMMDTIKDCEKIIEKEIMEEKMEMKARYEASLPYQLASFIYGKKKTSEIVEIIVFIIIVCLLGYVIYQRILDI